MALHTSEETFARSGSGGPAASHHYINMEYAPLKCISAAGPAFPKGLGFSLIAHLLLILKEYL